MSGEIELVEGETIIGKYSVEIARWAGGRWNTTVPPLYVTLTQARLILQPQTRRRYDPAVIPLGCIKRIADLENSPRRGILLYVDCGAPISLFTAGHQGEDFVRHLRASVYAGDFKTLHFEPQIDHTQLRRIIDCVRAI